MKLAIYLTMCLFTTTHCVPDQTWSAITKVEDRVDKLEKNINYKDVEDSMEKRLHENNVEMEKRFNKIVNEMATRVQTIEQTIKKLQSENSVLRNQIQELGAEASSSAVISFTASMTSGQFVPGGDRIVPFDEAISNPGGHYDVQTYKFICPSDNLQDGTDYDTCGGTLVMDGVRIVEAMGIHYDANIRDIKQVSNSAVVFCTGDSEVYVTAPYSNTGIYGANDRTTFSGFML